MVRRELLKHPGSIEVLLSRTQAQRLQSSQGIKKEKTINRFISQG